MTNDECFNRIYRVFWDGYASGRADSGMSQKTNEEIAALASLMAPPEYASDRDFVLSRNPHICMMLSEEGVERNFVGVLTNGTEFDAPIPLATAKSVNEVWAKIRKLLQG